MPEFAELITRIDATAGNVLAGSRCPIPHHGVLGPPAADATPSHPDNFLSGVYYLQTQAGPDTINFHDPRPRAPFFVRRSPN
jgi:hypothetical protein